MGQRGKIVGDPAPLEGLFDRMEEAGFHWIRTFTQDEHELGPCECGQVREILLFEKWGPGERIYRLRLVCRDCDLVWEVEKS